MVCVNTEDVAMFGDEDVPFCERSGLTAVVRTRQVLSAVTVKLSHTDWYRMVSQ